MKRSLRQLVVVLFALQMLLTTEVCLMLCCQPVVAAEDAQTEQLPPCHAKAATQRPATQAHKHSAQPARAGAPVVNVPCPHPHEEIPVANLSDTRRSRLDCTSTITPSQLPYSTFFAATNQSATTRFPAWQLQFHSPPHPPAPLALRI